MVLYYGRAKSRTGSVNTKQLGLKMGGCAGTVGKKGTIARYISKRACSSKKTVCGLSGGGYTCRHGVKGTWNALVVGKWCTKESNPCFIPQPASANIGGGVGRLYIPRLY